MVRLLCIAALALGATNAVRLPDQDSLAQHSYEPLKPDTMKAGPTMGGGSMGPGAGAGAGSSLSKSPGSTGMQPSLINQPGSGGMNQQGSGGMNQPPSGGGGEGPGMVSLMQSKVDAAVKALESRCRRLEMWATMKGYDPYGIMRSMTKDPLVSKPGEAGAQGGMR
eukprot:TRINITY_DN90336_c0_g1_i1.p1 TRINITY_DN90336_c0_g1~~TRINITY_DN90336_c0_g1_i1.p1  ORF type:complete len:166 (-),score=28.21 TRINITY_DN90336_c0_g1_i1:164-661(-)